MKVRVDPADPVFAGHYPGFPVLPGVYLIGYADQAVRAEAATGGGVARLVAVERCRFQRPVYPGDEVVVDVATTSRQGRDLRCRAVVATARGPVADIRLRYDLGEEAPR